MGKDERRNRKLLEEFLSSPRVDIVEIDEETSERYAIILNALREKGTPIPTNDIWIASSAMQYGLRVLTTDTHYLQISQVLVECLDQR
jgi:predicted nucleic acid-binding protein